MDEKHGKKQVHCTTILSKVPVKHLDDFLLDKLWLVDAHKQCLLEPEESESDNEIPTKLSFACLGESNQLAIMLNGTLFEQSMLEMLGQAEDIHAL